jgi:hypothetical protein
MDALLGAPLLLHPPGALAAFEDLEEHIQQRVCVSIFFAINWVREVINMFCTQTNAPSQAKVLQRLSHLHLLEQQLEVCLKALHVAGSEFAFLPDAHDPCAALGEIANPSTKKKAKVEKKKKADKEADAGGAAVADGPDDFLRVRSIASRFRFIDLDAVKILSYASTANPDLQFCSLRPFALHALISVVHANCEALLEPAKKAAPFARKATATSREADSRWAGKPLQALGDVILPAVPALNENLQRLGQIVTGDEAEWAFNEELQYDQDEASESPERQRMEIWWYVIPAQRMVMGIFERILRWLQLTSVKLTAEEAKPYDRLARQFFEAIAPPLGAAGSAAGAGSGSAELRKTAYNYLVCYEPSIQTMSSAVSFTRLLEIVALYGVDRKFLGPALHTPDGVVAESPERALLSNLSNACDAFLRRKWSATSGGAKSADVRALLEMHLSRSVQPTAALQVIVAALEKLTGSEGLSGDAADEQLDAVVAADEGQREELHTLTKATLTLFYKSAFHALVNVLREVDFANHEGWSVEQRTSCQKKLGRLNTMFGQLVSMCRKKVPTQVQASALREGKLYVEMFQLALPMLGISIQLQADDKEALKRLRVLVRKVQGGTRVMQTMCACAKSSGEKALLTLVPSVKKALQKFVLEVKRMMNSLGLSDAVVIGALKHKDMDGNELGSQVTYMVEAPEEEEEQAEAEAEEVIGPDFVVLVSVHVCACHLAPDMVARRKPKQWTTEKAKRKRSSRMATARMRSNKRTMSQLIVTKSWHRSHLPSNAKSQPIRIKMDFSFTALTSLDCALKLFASLVDLVPAGHCGERLGSRSLRRGCVCLCLSIRQLNQARLVLFGMRGTKSKSERAMSPCPSLLTILELDHGRTLVLKLDMCVFELAPSLLQRPLCGESSARHGRQLTAHVSHVQLLLRICNAESVGHRLANC